MEKYECVFSHFYSNDDGKISSVELCHCVSSIGGDMTVEEAEAKVALVDFDRDGLMCLEDFLKIVEAVGEKEKAGDLKTAFQVYALQESACITPASLRRMLSRLGARRSVDDCKTIIAHFDLNDNGVLNFDEFKFMMSC